MSQDPKATTNITGVLDPAKLLEQLAITQTKGCLTVTTNGITWRLYFYEGKLVYANHSLEISDRLEQYLRQISPNSIPNEIYSKLRDKLKNVNLSLTYPSADYQLICWLISKNYITKQAAELLIKNISKEVIQSYLLITSGTSELISNHTAFPILWSGNFLFITKECQTDIQAWKALQPAIQSAYQRPYLMDVKHPLLTPELKIKMSKILIGFSFKQLSLLLKQDELTVAKSLYKLVDNQIVGLHPPRPPFNRMHELYSCKPRIKNPAVIHKITNNPDRANSTTAKEPKYTIVCVDDSPTILREINRFLDRDNFTIFSIIDSGNALMKIIRINPNIILLDVGMPSIDGYKLCSMLRKHPAFKKTPIIMVTGNTGILDRAKGKIAGSTDYMTKPLTQIGLIEMVSKHLISDS